MGSNTSSTCRGVCIALSLAAVIGAPAGTARAAIAYDAITGLHVQGTVISSDSELAQDTTLADGVPLTLSAVQFSVWSPSMHSYTGTMRVSLYADAGGAPGALLATTSAQITVPPMIDTEISIPFPDIDLSTRSLWTGWIIQNIPANSPGVNYTPADPVVGFTTRHVATREGGGWSVAPTPVDTMMVRIITVPSPAATGALAGAALLSLWRRRR